MNASTTTSEPVLRAEHLTVKLPSSTRRLFHRADEVMILDDVSLELRPDRTYGVVGESGSGKSTLGRALIGVQEGVSGTVTLAGAPVPAPDTAGEKALRRRAQMIYQNPLGSFDPRQTVREAMVEALRAHGRAGGDLNARLEELLDAVGLPAGVLDTLPRKLSGGQRQRAAIARAISLKPTLIVADEPFAALDVTTQAKVVALMARLQRERGLTQVVISHDLSLMDLICDEVFVLYLGGIVEAAPAEKLAASPAHPYTLALRSAIPVPDPAEQRTRERILLRGDPPGPAARPDGCAFHTRCPFAVKLCTTVKPELRDIGGGQRAACHFAEDVRDGTLRAPEAAA